ncbi:hypothetical protein PU630_01090 [Microbacterium horticulturae]|uniref:Alpha/beta hydrolase family protein n=1 Tax=Microbacterium horticulturae TaxID=3028316 RepID=A0ABY8BYD3_9MICO|nr:hypothetical protein [Microbacterium sp. KACC 23027]WEG09188.1 hypothetical protein PU630_01090 [Microbacterium sp. KACC 23027]
MTLRFDYDGTGDSYGKWEDPGRLDAWTNSIRSAVAEVRLAGCTNVSAVGVRMGATLLAATASDLGLRSAVLWDPITDGRKFLRRQNLLLSASMAGSSDTTYDGVDALGYAFPAAVAEELRQLQLESLMPNLAGLDHVLYAHPTESGLSKALLRVITESSNCETLAVAGQVELLEVSPERSEIPMDALVDISRWLCTVADDVLAAIHCQSGRDSIEISDGGRVVAAERARSFGTAQLFGIFTEPVGEMRAEASSRPWLVMLNNGAETHIGPGRRWVEWSRQWAALGFRCCRIDLSGLGDSGVWPGQDRLVILAPQWMEDATEIIQELSPEESPGVVFMGLCSGAHVAIEAALSDHPPRGVVALNAILRENSLRLKDLRNERRRAWRPDPKIIDVISRRNPRLGQRLARAVRELHVRSSPFDPFAKAARAGVNVLAIYGPGDIWQFGNDIYWRRFGVPRLQRRHAFEFVRLRTLDHSLYHRAAQCDVERLVRTHLLENYGNARDLTNSAEGGGLVDSTSGVRG